MYRNLPLIIFDQLNDVTKPYIGKLPIADKTKPTSGDKAAKAARLKAAQLVQSNKQDGMPTEGLFRLRKIAETAVVMKKLHPDQLLIFKELWEVLRATEYVKPLSETAIWSQALEKILSYMQGCSFRCSISGSSREHLVGEALLTLSRKGFPFKVDGHGASLKEVAYNNVCKLIEKKIRRVGGWYVANALLNLMAKAGRLQDGTLLHARTPKQLGGKTRSGTPWHYIYSLALKHIQVRPTCNNPEHIFETMEELAVLLAASLDVEPHSSYENMSLPTNSLVGVLFETVIYDELFAMPQWQPMAAKKLVPLWLVSLSRQSCDFPIGTLQNWTTMWEKIWSISSENSLVSLKEIDLRPAAIAPEIAKQIIAEMCAPVEGVNQKYKTPSDTQHRTACVFPILQTKEGYYIVQPRAVVARSFCESLYTAMRKAKVHNLENKMGDALEHLTKLTFEAAGMPANVVGETYDNVVMGKNLEVDLVVETPERIFLIECTKKPLTNRARGGHTLDGLRDLSRSFLKLTQQLAQHEAHLRTVGNITFDNGQIIHLSGRSIEKIGISLFDHGSLQNRDMTIGFIEALVNAQMQADDPDAQSTVKGFNKRLSALNKALSKIVAFQSDGQKNGLFRFAMSTWWLSIDQLQYLALKENDLWKTMERVRHMTARSGDIVYELNTTLNMNEVGNAMFDTCRKMDNRGVL